ncbi:hypothetical protein VP01_2061g4 [Puccinia sorghi]|uniref:Uncharacterized protein n=1 Tax=Puccinia sorghi TaxID=27349 RepID=A0A0L6VAW8_9BASI|nr:hypothetical protein VP01_2061g4 [Puccinia sorghi]
MNGTSRTDNPLRFPFSGHHRSNSLSGLVRRKSNRMKSSGLAIPGFNTISATCNPLALASAISREQAPAEPPMSQDPPSSREVRLSHRHSMTHNIRNPGSSQVPQPALFHINTLPIIQPRTTSPWSSMYDLDRRSFRVNLQNPRQQVTSLLALSSVPRPLSPCFDEERENSASVISAATRSAIEEEAIQAAIAASLLPEHHRHQHHQPTTTSSHLRHWADTRHSHPASHSPAALPLS